MKPIEKLEKLKYIIAEEYKNGISGCKLETKYNIPRPMIYKKLKQLGVVSRHQSETSMIYKPIDINCFNEIDTEWKAYFLGFLYADGSLNKEERQCSLRLHKKDKHILYELSEKIYGEDKPILEYGNNYDFTISNIVMCKDLLKHGVINKKTFLIRLPKLNNKLMRHFIRGYFDGDGSVHYNSKTNPCRTCSIISNKEFILELHEYLKKYKILSKIKQHQKSSNYYINITRYDNINKLYTFLYNNATIYLTRKKEIFDEFFNYTVTKMNKLHSPIWGISYATDKNRWYSKIHGKFSGYMKAEDDVYKYLQKNWPDEYP
jgi:DNA-binding transcriptional regulator WhiA